MKSIAVLVALFPNFEATEMVVPTDLLRRANVTVVTASLGRSLEVKASPNLLLKADRLFNRSLDLDAFDMLLIPGGPGLFDIQGNEALVSAVKHFHEKKKWVAAICAAPLVLKNAGCLPKRFTCHSCVAEELQCSSTDSAVVDEKEKIITGRGPGAVFPFAWALIERLTDAQTVLQLKRGIHEPEKEENPMSAKKQGKASSFLLDLLKASSPSGYENEAQAVIEKYVAPVAESMQKDTMGNRIATIHAKGSPRVLLSGHMDEIGLIITRVDEKGFLFFETIGGHDPSLILGQKVRILTKNGHVYGMVGRRAVHLLKAEERKQVPEISSMHIDIGAKDKKEALKLVAIGDAAVFDNEPFLMGDDYICARGLDDRVGTYVVQEVLRRLSGVKMDAALIAVSSTQEEVGLRGAKPAAHGVNPDVGIAVDVGHATDFPNSGGEKIGEFHLGKGPVITRGPNICPKVFEGLKACAERNKIPYQLEAQGGVTGTDACVIQTTKKGVAAGLVSPLVRYMHGPLGVASLQDIEWTVQLLVEYIKSLKASDSFEW
ncbi:MAG: DJ-1/PfpI family protein [Opitutales bacterium]|nr:DJ-1/PfpI family protein [Opitutales bacterium]